MGLSPSPFGQIRVATSELRRHSRHVLTGVLRLPSRECLIADGDELGLAALLAGGLYDQTSILSICSLILE
jgi:hypothetical protein